MDEHAAILYSSLEKYNAELNRRNDINYNNNNKRNNNNNNSKNSNNINYNNNSKVLNDADDRDDNCNGDDDDVPWSALQVQTCRPEKDRINCFTIFKKKLSSIGPFKK